MDIPRKSISKGVWQTFKIWGTGNGSKRTSVPVVLGALMYISEGSQESIANRETKNCAHENHSQAQRNYFNQPNEPHDKTYHLN